MWTDYISPNSEVYPVGIKVYYSDGRVEALKDDARIGPNVNLVSEWIASFPPDNIDIVIVFENTLDALGRPTRVLLMPSDSKCLCIDQVFQDYNL
jgi:hypothetical protein